MNANWWFRAVVLGPLLRLLFPVRVTGLENLPKSGSFIFAAGSHTTEIESAIIAANLWRLKIRFFAKAEYWDINRVAGWFMTATGQVPINRQARDIQGEVVDVGVRILREGRRIVLLIYPESTRSFDGKVHRGAPSAARIALQADVPIVPMGLVGMDTIQPPGTSLKKLRFFQRGSIHIGAPVYPWQTSGEKPKGLLSRAAEGAEARLMTETVMKSIAALTYKQYSHDRLKIPGT